MNAYRWFRPLLFALPPERAHALTLRLLRVAARPPLRRLLETSFGVSESAPVEVAGLQWPNRLGLAAGYDKNGVALDALARLGFGHLEVGTVTPEPQEGNARPRVFRLPEDRALVNRLGFPNDGAERVATRLFGFRQRWDGGRRPLVGVNLGKQASTPLERAVDDYLSLVDVFAPLADYLVVNVSSPNTPGLRELQDERHLEDLIGRVVARRDRLAAGRTVPLFVKIAPDLADEELRAAVTGASRAGAEGIIATNTTTDRTGLTSRRAKESGGLSGAPLMGRSTEVLEEVAGLVRGGGRRLALVGVGGVMSGADAAAKAAAGADLVQLYTGLVYRGPALIEECCRALSEAPA